MNLSEKTKQSIYNAISEPIMNKRIAVAQSENVLGSKNAKDINELLCRLEREIWQRVKKSLNIS